MITFTTSDPEAKVSGFIHRARAKTAGLKDSASMAASGSHMMTVNNAATGESLTVQTSINHGKTQAVLLVRRVGRKYTGA